MSMTLYDDLLQAGVEMSNHESDLYIPVTKVTTALLAKHGKTATTFTNQVKGGLWYDVPFMFEPWWEKVRERNAQVAAWEQSVKDNPPKRVI